MMWGWGWAVPVVLEGCDAYNGFEDRYPNLVNPFNTQVIDDYIQDAFEDDVIGEQFLRSTRSCSVYSHGL